MENIKVIRTAAGSTVSWGLIAELKNKGVEVIGVDADKQSFAFHLLEKSYVIPKGNHPDFIKRILEIVEKEKPDAIITGPEEELIALSKNKEEIEKRGTLVLCPDREYVEICADKKKTNEFFIRMGIPIPETYSNFESVIYPCIIKPRFGRGSTGIHIATNEKELKCYLEDFDSYVVQELIEGDEYTIDLLTDKDGIALSIVPRIRIQTESGVSVKGITVNDFEIIEYCRKIAKELKLFGPSCIQCIRGKEGPKFIEINTRFGGGSILSIKADPTIIPNLVKLIKGEKTKPSTGFKEGLTMLRYYSEVIF
ncbi:MAG: ATP-grasp domain-containing protein [Candidatus Hermodarchaeota archaeon]